jgi:hypothetical protein
MFASKVSRTAVRQGQAPEFGFLAPTALHPLVTHCRATWMSNHV